MNNNSSVPLEIERKFVILTPSLSWLERQPGARKVEIEQTYLLSDASCSRRVRLWREEDELHCFRGLKRSLSDMTRIEEEDEISLEEYRELLSEADPARRPVRKTRWCVPYEGHVLEIDIYPFWDTQAVLECELGHEEEAFSIPPEITVLREVTSDRRYLNSALAGMSEEELAKLVISPESSRANGGTVGD